MTPEILTRQFDRHTASALVYRGSGPALLFHHATALGPRAYARFLGQLTPHYDVTALNMRPLWPIPPAPAPRRGWDLFGDDLIRWVEATQTSPVLAVRHSIGAASLAMAAVKRPELFSGIVLIEPSGATWQQYVLMRLIPYRLRTRLGPIKTALATPTSWPSAQAAFDDFRARKSYRHFDDAALQSLLAGILPANPTQIADSSTQPVALEYPRSWERHLYATAPYTFPTLTKLTVPTEVIRGRPSLFMDGSVATRLRRKRPDIPISDFPQYGHLLPLEAPEPVAEATLNALSRLRA